MQGFRNLWRFLQGLLPGHSASSERARAVDGKRNIDFRVLAENSNDVICQVDRDLMPVYVSPAVERLLGWTPQEIILGGPRFIHPEDAPMVAKVHGRLIAGEEEVAKVSCRLLKKDGSPVWVEVNARLVRGAKGAIPEVVIVMRDISDRKQLEDELRTLSFTDGLTGLSNRRAFDAALAQEWLRTTREGSQMSLLLLDIDHFKSFNDLYGHQAGDDCLRIVSSAVENAIRRPGDMAARYGGEEIAVILPATDADGAQTVAEAVRAGVEALAVHHAGNSNANRTVTVSIGAATAFARVGGTMDMPQGLLLAADGALYKAKQNGRNRVATAVLFATHREVGGTS